MTATIKRPADAFSIVTGLLQQARHSLRPLGYRRSPHIPDGWGVELECTECGWTALALLTQPWGMWSVYIHDGIPDCTTTTPPHVARGGKPQE